MSAFDIAEAYRRVTTGDEEPPRPWAHLSHVGIIRVSELGGLTVRGYHDGAGFEVTTSDGAVYRVMVTRL